MPLDELLAELERQASERIEDELSRARERTDELLARAHERVDAERRRVLDAHRDERRDEDERRLTAARRDASRRVYEARRRFLDRVFEAAREQLDHWQAQESVPPEALAALEDALPYLAGEEAVLLAPAPWRSAIEERLGDAVRLLESSQRSEAPVLALATDDGRRVVDLSPAPRLEHARAELSIDLLRELGAPTWSPTAET